MTIARLERAEKYHDSKKNGITGAHNAHGIILD
jgi:hypothetical protein